MTALSPSVYSWGKFILRLALVLVLVLGQGSAAGSVFAQDGAPERVELKIDFDALPEDLAPADIEITPADSALHGMVDTMIDQYPSNANTNYGFDMLKVGYGNYYRQRSLIEPSLSKIPPNATITSATLRLYFCDGWEFVGETRTVTFYRVTSPWHQSLATWNHAPTSGESVGSFSVKIPNSITDPIQYNLNVTSVVQNWVNGTYPNYGLLMTGMEAPVHGGDTYLEFCSNDTYYGPQLIINYNATAPTLGSTPATLGLAHDPTWAAPQTKELALKNNGSSIFEWQATKVGDWLSISPSSGEVGPGSSQSIVVSFDPSGLAPGTHSGQINLTSSTAGVVGFPRTVPVTLTVASFDDLLMLPLVMKSGTATSTATRDVATLIIGISDYLYLGEYPSGGDRAGAWGYDLEYSGLDSTKETRTLSVFGLHHAANDCNCADGAGGGMAPSSLPSATGNILTLTDSEATYENIAAAFAWLDEHEGPNTTVQIFYSGHGGKMFDLDGDETADGLDEFISAYDTNEGGFDYVNVISDDELNTWLSNLESSRVAVLLDACFSGGMMGPAAVDDGMFIRRGLRPPSGAALSAEEEPGIGLASDLAATGREVVTASTVDESSFENGALQQGVFSYYLLMAMLNPGIDTDNDSIVSVEEAFIYLAPRVSSFMSGSGYSQTPQFYDGVAGGSVGLSWATDATSPCK